MVKSGGIIWLKFNISPDSAFYRDFPYKAHTSVDRYLPPRRAFGSASNTTTSYCLPPAFQQSMASIYGKVGFTRGFVTVCTRRSWRFLSARPAVTDQFPIVYKEEIKPYFQRRSKTCRSSDLEAHKNKLARERSLSRDLKENMSIYPLLRERLTKMGHTMKELETIKRIGKYAFTMEERQVTARVKGPWSEEETRQLLEMRENHMHLRVIADRLGRDEEAVRVKIRRHWNDLQKCNEALSIMDLKLFHRNWRILFSTLEC